MEDTNTQWHLGLKPAVDLELAEERANLSYFRDFSLNQQALEIDIADTIEDIYGFEISHETISSITDRVWGDLCRK